MFWKGINANGCEPREQEVPEIDLFSAGRAPLWAALFLVPFGDPPTGTRRRIEPCEDMRSARRVGRLTYRVENLRSGIYLAQTNIPVYSDNSQYKGLGFYFTVKEGGALYLSDCFGVAK